MCAYGTVCVYVCSHELGIVGNDVLLTDSFVLLGVRFLGHGVPLPVGYLL